MPRDGGGFVLSPEEKEELVRKEPLAAKWIKPYIGAVEFLSQIRADLLTYFIIILPQK